MNNMRLALLVVAALVAVEAVRSPEDNPPGRFVRKPTPEPKLWQGKPSRGQNQGSHSDYQYASDDPAISSANEDPDFRKFQQFIRQYNKSYRNLEELKVRFGLFKKSLREVDRLNAENTSAKSAINSFSDRTDNELASIHGFNDHNRHNRNNARISIPPY